MNVAAIARLAIAAAFALAASAACADDDDTPVTGTPSGGGATGSPLYAARADLAERLDLAALEVELRSLVHAGWDGCAGVVLPGRACASLFGGGYVAMFEAAEKPYRYHVLGAQFYATDLIKGAKIDDGSPVPPELRVDFIAILAEYSRLDLERLRPTAIGKAVTAHVTAIVPARWSSTCPGFQPRGQQACTKDLARGAIVLLEASNAKTYRYHVTPASGVVATDFVPGAITAEPDAATLDLQQKMRADLARRLKVDVSEISVRSYREVTWSDGCLGISLPGRLCTQALVDGVFAILTDKGGKEYRYHAANGNFIAASFEPNATVTNPLPRDE